MQKIAAEKKKPIIFAGSASTLLPLPALTNKECSAYGIHWVYDTYALATGTGRAVVRRRGRQLVLHYRGLCVRQRARGRHHRRREGHGRQGRRDGEASPERPGLRVRSCCRPRTRAQRSSAWPTPARTRRTPSARPTSSASPASRPSPHCWSSTLTSRGWASRRRRAWSTPLPSTGTRTRRRARSPIVSSRSTRAQNQETREFSNRFHAIHKGMPTMIHAGAYSAAMHYLKSARRAQVGRCRGRARSDAQDADQRLLREERGDPQGRPHGARHVPRAGQDALGIEGRVGHREGSRARFRATRPLRRLAPAAVPGEELKTLGRRGPRVRHLLGCGYEYPRWRSPMASGRKGNMGSGMAWESLLDDSRNSGAPTDGGGISCPQGQLALPRR